MEEVPAGAHPDQAAEDPPRPRGGSIAVRGQRVEFDRAAVALADRIVEEVDGIADAGYRFAREALATGTFSAV